MFLFNDTKTKRGDRRKTTQHASFSGYEIHRYLTTRNAYVCLISNQPSSQRQSAKRRGEQTIECASTSLCFSKRHYKHQRSLWWQNTWQKNHWLFPLCVPLHLSLPRVDHHIDSVNSPGAFEFGRGQCLLRMKDSYDGLIGLSKQISSWSIFSYRSWKVNEKRVSFSCQSAVNF